MIENLKQVDAFKELREASYDLIEKSAKRYKYTMGQPLSIRKEIACVVQVIVSGTARLIGSEDQKSFTVDKMNRGEIVCLSSILNAQAIEEVSAAGDLETIAIPDEVILKLYNEDNFFKNGVIHNCTNVKSMSMQICKAVGKKSWVTEREIYKLIESIAVLRVVTCESPEVGDRDNTWFVGSGNAVGLNAGNVFKDKQVLNLEGPFPLRLIGLPNEILKKVEEMQITENSDEMIDNRNKDNRGISNAPLIPERTGLELGQNTKNKRVELISGHGINQEVRACLEMMCKYLDVPFRRDSVEKILLDTSKDGRQVTIQLCGNLAGMLGLHSYGAKIPRDILEKVQVPSIIFANNQYSVITKASSKGLEIASPNEGWKFTEYENIANEFEEEIEILMLERKSDSPNKKFGISWFAPILKKYQNILIQVFLASFVVQLFGLANPLLIQVIIDKVISQRSLDTLQVLGYALIIVTIMGGILGSIRTFLFAETTNRIDTRLGSEVLDHLLRLPLNYFDKRPVGELGTRIGELEKIRSFLTGQALTTILDASFSIIYIVVMVIYSPFLTLIALGVVPIQTGLTLFGAPLIRRQIKRAAEQNALTQSHLVEVLTGMQTVKAQNVEVVSRWKWQKLYNKYISRTFEKTISTTLLNEVSNVLQQLSQLFVLWVGATQVLSGDLTLGQLIAFRIISGYVTQPLLRLSSIWQSIQELRVSFERLSDIIDTPEESDAADQSNIPLKSIEGNVEFENIDFRFKEGSEKILNNVSLEVKKGTFVGIVGQSGSGKSTLMKLLPRLYSPSRGKILIDGFDIDKVELDSLRRQIGIVPQDPLLFKGTISENISLTNPDASSDEIINAALMADAHEFIMKLPLGYSTDVGERGAALSGGQRQRIAIARTILNNPKMLVMDEATSALDYKTEKTVCENLRKQCKGKTVFFITHRLSTIKNADKIVMMHNGVAEEIGTHDELMEKRGRYFALYKQQDNN